MKSLTGLFLCAFLTLALIPKALAAADQPTNTTDITITQELSPEATYNYTFPNTPVNSTRYHSFWLNNNTYRPIYISNVSLWGQAFGGNSGCYGWLGPGQRCRTTVTFSPWYQGYFSGRLTFYINYGNVYLNLYGWGVYW